MGSITVDSTIDMYKVSVCAKELRELLKLSQFDNVTH